MSTRRFLPLLLVSLVGCAEEAKTESRSIMPAPAKSPIAANGQDAFAGAKPGEAQRNAAPPGAVARKIIYKSQVSVTVDNYARAEAAVARLVATYHGYVSEANQVGSPGRPRSGRWVIRVPVESYEHFTDEVAHLGELQNRSVESQDVTEEFFDLDARIKNKKVEETRLLKHLEASTGNLKDILEVEREVSRVREEVERIQGRLQLLANLTALTTVTLSIGEREAFLPTESPSYGTRLSRRFFGSFESFVGFLGGLVLDLASLVPWLPLWGVILGLAWLAYRRFVRPNLNRRIVLVAPEERLPR